MIQSGHAGHGREIVFVIEWHYETHGWALHKRQKEREISKIESESDTNGKECKWVCVWERDREREGYSR